MSSKLSIQSYPRPSKPIELPVPFCPPAPFLPLRSPPKSDPPPLPSRPPITALSGWKRSEHALPAAYPRAFVETSGKLDRESEPHTQGSIPKDESKEARTQRATEELKRVTTARYYATRTQEGDVERPGLWIAAERWQREQEGKGEGLVLVCTHANGFHKEVCNRPIASSRSGPPRISAEQLGMVSDVQKTAHSVHLTGFVWRPNFTGLYTTIHWPRFARDRRSLVLR